MSVKLHRFSPLLIGLAVALPLGAQNTTATILGMVKDASGALVPGASVIALQKETNYSRSVASDAAGAYVMPLLPVGVYSVRASAPGFKTIEKRDIVLQLEQRASVDFVLEVGQAADSITVTGEAPVTEAYASERGQVIENTEIRELPLNGRNFTHLMRLTPGVIHYAGNNVATTPDDTRPRISFGNVSSVYNRYLLDGASNTDFHDSQTVINPSIEAIQEFNIKGSFYNAEYGGGGGIVNATVKSGGNQLHGALFEFLRNDKLDARPFFSPSRSAFRYNQFGGVVSGPVWIPKAYRGTNRTFFLFNYEGLRVRTPSDRFLRVPTAEEKAGNFSSLAYQLYDPATLTATGQRTPYAGNVVPRQRWSPYVERILTFWPEANLPLNTRNQNYFVAARNTTDANQNTVRIDHRFNDRWSLFGRFSQSKRDEVTAESFLGAGGNLNVTDGKQLAIGLTRMLSAHAISETRLGFARFTYVPEQNTRLDRNFDQELGFPYASQIQAVEYGFPTISPSGYTALGTPRYRAFGPNHSWNLNQSVTLSRGAHTFKFGGSWDTFRAETRFFVARTWSFNGSYTALVSGGRFTTAGSSFADFLLGAPQAITFGPTLPGVGRTANTILATSYGFFFQDDWRVSPRLTINYGLRYELNRPPMEADNRTLIGSFSADGKVSYSKDLGVDDQYLPTQFANPVTVDGRVVPAGVYFNRVDRRTLWDMDANNFQPRLGLAFLPFGNERTVIRASGGLFNGRNSGKLGYTAGLGAPFFIQQSERPDQTLPPGSRKLGELPAAQFTPSGVFQYNMVPTENPDPIIQSWTFGVQRQLPGRLLLEASYLGNRSYHITTTRMFNVRHVPGAETGVGCPAPCPVARPFPRLFPWYDEDRTRTADAWSNFNAAVLKLERRFHSGFAFLTSFTWSKGLDNGGFVAGDDVNGAQGSSVTQNNMFNLRAERGRSALNVEKRYVANWVYDLPFGRGRKFASSRTTPLSLLISDWQLSGIVTLQSGFFFTPIASTDISGDGQSSDRLNRVKDGNLPSGQRSIDRWFDTSAFELPALNTFGNAARAILEGPGTAIIDFGVFRQFRIRERHSFQFRAEFFNAFNHPTFALPNRTIAQPNYGVITGTSGSPRNIQFALKYLF
jgi:hypothetical protein